mmetsp:Transcript_2038/g.4816  ORF Transcript_2038/g.4816 Transcript_2038/m.4816 type:complete len:932 (-) Transcript_2038:357-3152(-)
MPDDEVPTITAPKLVLDDKTTVGFVRWYQSLPQNPTVIRFFDRKEFYSVHGDAALFVARTFCKTTAVVKYLGNPSDSLASVCLNRNLFENVLRDLLIERAEFSVELFEGSGTSWRKTRTASPGKLGAFEEELFRNNEMADVPVVVSVWLQYAEGHRQVGVAFLDASRRTIGACEFADDEQFCRLEMLAVQLGAKECVLPKDGDASAETMDGKRIREVLQRCSAMCTERGRDAFSVRNLEQDLRQLVKGHNVERYRDALERPLASAAVAALLSFSEILADSDSHGKYILMVYDAGCYMRLDAAAQRALNVFKSRSDASDHFSLYGLLSRSKTAMGKRLLKVWLKQPLVDRRAIEERHDIVEAFAADAELREQIRDGFLRGMPDVERLTRKLERKKVGLADLCQLYRASSKLTGIASELARFSGEQAPVLQRRFIEPLTQAHDQDHLTKFEELLEAAVDLDRVPDEYLVCASYSEDLLSLKEEKDGVEARIEELAQAIASDLGLIMDKSIKLEWHKVNNTRTRCVRITAKEEKAVRKKLSAKYMMLETRKDGTKFTNRALKDAAQQLSDLTAQYNSKQQELVEQVVSVAHSFCEVWSAVGGVLAEIDVLAGFADLAVSAPTPYVRPEMLDPDAGEVSLHGSRHPCLEAQDHVDFIKNDAVLERGSSWFQIITGPNMGGKSTFIRQVGVCVLMAQVGCFVPCDSARIAVRDCIFARVGAGDCQMRGVSTFMAEMLETASILKGATSKSLVIMDELGRGTSTYDGFGLAWAISEHLMQEIGCATLFATHFHELTALTGEVGVKNLHVETALDEATGRLTMLYKVSDGACDQSFGIHVAEYAQFPEAVLELARKKAAELEDFGDPAEAAEGRKRKDPPKDSDTERARKFLKDFAALPLDTMTEEEGLNQARALVDALKADANSCGWLSEVVQCEAS